MIILFFLMMCFVSIPNVQPQELMEQAIQAAAVTEVSEAGVSETEAFAEEVSELTMEHVISLFRNGTIGEEDYTSYENGEKEEAEAGVLNYYINFTLPYQGEDYRLGMSYSVEDDELEDIYITRESDTETGLLYTREARYTVIDDIEAFLNHKVVLSDIITVELPEGYTLSAYHANLGVNGGALIEPLAYEVKGDSFGSQLPEWTYSGVISIIADKTDWFLFENNRIMEKRGWYWNHSSEEKIETLDGLAMPAILYHGSHDLYTAAEIGDLSEQGIELSEEEYISEYWYIYFAEEESREAYYLSLDARQFTKEQAVEIAKTVRFLERR